MHPDPSVCRVGRDAYLVTSSFEYFPGVPIFRSRNLVDWEQVGHVLTRRSQLDLTGTASSGGIYAPTLRFHDGTFYLVTTHAGRGNFVVTASRPQGPWSDPMWLDEEGIDPSLAFLDGRIHYTRNGPGSDPDHPFVYQGELTSSAGGLELLRPPRVIWKGTGGIWPEAPHLYRRGRHYYLVTAEGGTSYGHSVVVARGGRADGPFEASPHGPLVTHRDRPRDPIQAVGHADLVDLDDGTTWAVLLGIRVTGGRHHHLGRETFLAPVTWGDDGWPRMEPVRPTVPVPGGTPAAAARDDFDTRRLARSWMFVRNPDARDWSLSQRPGYLRLWGSAATLNDRRSPALVCRRQQHFDVVARTRVEFEPRGDDEQAGLCVRASDEFHAALLVGRRGRRRELLLLRTLGGRAVVAGRSETGTGALTLEVSASRDAYVFRGGTGRRLATLGSVPTRALSAETITRRTGRHHFTGCVIGLVATGNGRRSTAPADFDWFDYLPAP